MAEQIDLNATASRTIIRSTFRPDKPFEHTFTCNTGDVVPGFMTINVLPHDTWKYKINLMIKQQTPLHPTIGRAYWMWVAYYTPHIQVWKNWNAFLGEVKDAAWISQTAYTTPKINITNTIKSGTFLDHIGWRIGNSLIGATRLTSLKLRHYLHICNEWLRDQNYEAPIYTTDPSISVTDGVVTLTGAELYGDTAISNGDTLFGGGKLYQINRKAEYFSVVLPEPQRGDPVSLPLGTRAPIIDKAGDQFLLQSYINPSTNTTAHVYTNDPDLSYSAAQLAVDGPSPFTSGESNYLKLNPNSVEVDLTNATAADINALRTAARTQQIYELDARAGSRAPEMLYARWGVEVDELELGRPRMLAADQGIIDIFQVEQTSSTDSTSPLGSLAGTGQAASEGDWNTFSAKYHGCFCVLFWIRTEHKYQYGVPREDLMDSRFDSWHPEFNGEGDQPTYKAEIWATAANVNNPDSSIWGYNERGAELKSFPSIITGELRSDAATVQNIDGTVHGSLESWTYADKYAAEPVASKSWMKESPENVDRTIHVQSSEADQWLVDFAMEMELTRAIHAHSIPGIDRV